MSSIPLIANQCQTGEIDKCDASYAEGGESHNDR